MAKTGQSASKQRKQRQGQKPKAVVEVNERQIAGGSLATTGDRGSDFITRVADFLQANAIIVLGVLAVGLIMAVVSIWMAYTESSDQAEIRTKITLAADNTTAEEVMSAFDALGESIEESPKFSPYYYYEYAISMIKAYESDDDREEEEKTADLARINQLIADYETASEKYDDPSRERRLAMLNGVAERLNSFERALKTDHRLMRLEDAEQNDPEALVIKSAWRTAIGYDNSEPSILRDGDAIVLRANDQDQLRLEFDRDGQVSKGTAIDISKAESLGDVITAIVAAVNARSDASLVAMQPRGRANAVVFASSSFDNLEGRFVGSKVASINHGATKKEALMTLGGSGATLPEEGGVIRFHAMVSNEAKELAAFEFDLDGDGVERGTIAITLPEGDATRATLAQAFLAAAQAATIENLTFSASGDTGVSVSYKGEGDLSWEEPEHRIYMVNRSGGEALEALTTVIVFETSKGTFKLHLYDVPQLRNTVNTLVTLTEREGYNEVSPSQLFRPGITPAKNEVFKGLNFTVFGQMVKLADPPGADGAEDEEADQEEDPDAEPERTVKKPYFAILEEDAPRSDSFGTLLTNERGTVSLFADLSEPKNRGTQFAINLGDNSRLDDVYPVIGYITGIDGSKVEDGLKVVSKMTTTDKVYRAYVERKQDRSYIPKVVMLEGDSNTIGLPEPWLEKRQELEQPVIDKVDEPKIVGDDERPQVVIRIKDRGDVLIELFEDETPNTVANFIHLVETNRYEGSDFHRVEGAEGKGDGLRIIQGGREYEPGTGDKAGEMVGQEGFDWTIKNEYDAETYDKYGLNRNLTGTIAMARQTDKDTAGNQFFFNLKDMPSWDGEENPYCVFGRVLENLWVLYNVRPEDEIEAVWVVQKRDHPYIPIVKKDGENEYGPAAELPVDEVEEEESADGASGENQPENSEGGSSDSSPEDASKPESGEGDE